MLFKDVYWKEVVRFELFVGVLMLGFEYKLSYMIKNKWRGLVLWLIG